MAPRIFCGGFRYGLANAGLFFIMQEISLCDIFEITTKAPFGAPAMHGRQVCKGVYDSVLHTFVLNGIFAILKTGGHIRNYIRF